MVSWNPSKSKEDHPNFDKLYFKYNNRCPLCEFYIDSRDDELTDCGDCFLKDNHDPDNDEICCYEFYQWVGSDKEGNFEVSDEDRIIFSTIIYEKIKTQYKKIIKKEKNVR